jgi:branched-chain amino acid transport system permease protein
MAAIVGLIVGVPSLRLKGDYLAIVTLGFGEIIRVVFQNSPAFGAATGLTGIPRLTTIFWTLGGGGGDGLCGDKHGQFDLRPRIYLCA